MKQFILTSVFMAYNLITFAGPRLDREDYHRGSSGGGGVAIIAVIIIGLILLFGGRKR